jgi:hypothetical protein
MRDEQQTAGRKHRSQQGSRDNDFLFHGRSRSQMKKLFQQPAGVIDAPVVPAAGHGAALVVVEEIVDGDVTVGIVGTDELGPTVPTMGDTFTVGTAGVELTPRLPISVDPNGTPVRAPPPGAMDDVDVGDDDAAILLEPDPHVPDNPDVSSVPEVIDVPDVADIPDDVDVPEVPIVAAVAGVAVPTAVPPPSKLAVDPNVPDGEVAKVEHAVPLLVLGIGIVPVTPLGTGLTPGDASSVAPNGIPIGEFAEPVAVPSGEVSPIVAVGVAVPTCAMATLQTKSAGRTATINETLIGVLRLQTASSRS